MRPVRPIVSFSCMLLTKWMPKEKENQQSAAACNGFTMAEALCALLCSITVFALCLSLMNACLNLKGMNNDRQSQFAILQIRQQAAISNERNVEKGVLKLKSGREIWEMKYDRGRIVRTPGYEIFIESIEDGCFYASENKIYLEIVEDGIRKTWQIF